jgi:nucleotide-binding universal stress UspA family protein
MPFRDILVHLDDSHGSIARLNAAIGLAQTHGAHLTGLYTLPVVDSALYGAAYAGPALPDMNLEAAERRAKEHEAEFCAATTQVGVRAEWRRATGDAAHPLIVYGRCHDLIVLGQTDPQDLYSLSTGAGSQVILGAGRPVLVIPYIGPGPTLGERILLAWNGSREAARAFNDALPLLTAAAKVSLVIIDPPGGAEAEGNAATAAMRLHLARHGIAATPVERPANDIDVGDELLSQAADEGADLIVMGAYGHSRLREIVLGGTTRRLLQCMTVPVLMSH